LHKGIVISIEILMNKNIFFAVHNAFDFAMYSRSLH